MTREYPDYPMVGVGVVVWKDETVLLIQRGKPPRAGAWSLPGGRQELGETTREAGVREVLEETGIKIEIKDLIDVVDTINRDDSGRVRMQYTLVDYWAEWAIRRADSEHRCRRRPLGASRRPPRLQPLGRNIARHSHLSQVALRFLNSL